MLAGIPTDGRILDNGCGVGLLHERIPRRRIVGLDISAEMLRRAADHYDQLILGNSQELPFRSGSFDVAFCRSLLHHLPEPERAVDEMRRVLCPGGRLVVADTNTSLLSALPRRLAYRGERFSDEHQNLSRRRLETLLRPRFTVDDVQYFGYVAYPLIGFPDLVRAFRYFVPKPFWSAALMSVDRLLANVPFVRTQSWGIIVKATRR
jgi:ubiquinone/menaquinone biosynthesis C-methylase UbiE